MHMESSKNNPIIIDAPDAITGAFIEHGYIDHFIDSLDGEIESIEQNLVLKDGRHFDQIILTLEDGSERI